MAKKKRRFIPRERGKIEKVELEQFENVLVELKVPGGDLNSAVQQKHLELDGEPVFVVQRQVTALILHAVHIEGETWSPLKNEKGDDLHDDFADSCVELVSPLYNEIMQRYFGAQADDVKNSES